ncbi:MAG: hypothetical protein WBV68_07015 [Exiguobacterium oxidotolerans]
MMMFFVLLFFLIHAVIVFLVAKLITVRMDPAQRGLVKWIALICYFVPLLGELFGLVSWLIARRYASDKTLLDYDDYIEFDVVNLEGLQQQAADNIDLVPMGEAMAMDAKERKQSIVRLTTTSIADSGKYLQFGLDHADSETVHYAATVRNTLYDRYEATIKSREEQLNPGHVTTYYQLIDAFEAFIDSGLLDESMQKRIFDRFGSYLQDMRIHYPTDATCLKACGKLALAKGDVADGLGYYERLIMHYPEQADGYLLAIEYHFTRGDWTKLAPLVTQLKTHVAPDDIPDDKRYILDRLEGVEL